MRERGINKIEAFFVNTCLKFPWISSLSLHAFLLLLLPYNNNLFFLMEREGIDVCQKITTVAEYECTYKKKGTTTTTMRDFFFFLFITHRNIIVVYGSVEINCKLRNEVSMGKYESCYRNIPLLCGMIQTRLL